MTKIVLVCTSATELKGVPTGLWIEELAAPYYAFKEAGYDVVVASPKGGPIPIDKGSMGEGFFTESAKKFMHDGEAIGELSHSVQLSTIDFSSGIEGIYLAAGHGACVDYIDNPALKGAIETLYAAGKLVGAVCHAPIALTECTKPDGSPLVQGLAVAGFTDAEEEAAGLTDHVPFLLETRCIEQGAKFEKVENWNPKVCVDGNLVTGQNPQSSDECAAAVIKFLST